MVTYCELLEQKNLFRSSSWRGIFSFYWCNISTVASRMYVLNDSLFFLLHIRLKLYYRLTATIEIYICMIELVLVSSHPRHDLAEQLQDHHLSYIGPSATLLTELPN